MSSKSQEALSLRPGTAPVRGAFAFLSAKSFCKILANLKAAGLILGLLFVSPVPVAAVEGFHFTREVKVAAPGWVRAPLDLAAIQHMTPGGAGLRVFSPAGAEVPVWLEPSTVAAVGEAGAPSLRVVTGDTECEAEAPGGLACVLSLPAAGQRVRRIEAEIEGRGRVGYRLYRPRKGRWHLRAEGIWQRGEERTRHFLTLGPEPIPDVLLRLELYGAPETPPRLVSYGVDLAVPAVLFEAREAGSYVLAYGGMARAEARRAGPPRAAAEAVWTLLEQEQEHAPPPLPALTATPSLRLDERRLAGSWRVVALSAKARTLVHLELPGLVYRFAREDLGNLRLVAGERQIPFFRWSPAAPALAFREDGLGLRERAGGSRESEVEIRLPHPGLPLTGLDLTIPAAPLRRTVGVRYLEPARPPRVADQDPPPLVRDVWDCRPQPPLPCRESLALSGEGPPELSVRLHDADNPPLADLHAALWRRRDVLLFVWPEGEEPVRLVAGPERMELPSYDLQALGDTLLSYPWQPAELDLEASSAEEEPWWSRWVRPMTLVIAGACLLVLLRRILMEA